MSALSPTNALLSWTPPLREHQNGIIIGYIVRVSGVDSDEQQELSVTQLSIVISGLHPFYSYRFSVAAETVAAGPFNNPLTLKMPESGKNGEVKCDSSYLSAIVLYLQFPQLHPLTSLWLM